MTKRVVMLVVAMVFAVSLGAAPPPPKAPDATGLTPEALQEARSLAQIAVAAKWAPQFNAGGCASSLARLDTRQVWLTAINVPGQQDIAMAGFNLPAVTYRYGMRGVKVRATFDLPVAQGYVMYGIVVSTGGVNVAEKWGGGVSPAPHAQVVTNEFVVDPHKPYTAGALVIVKGDSGAANAPASAAGTITEIRWDF
ncbi:MAG TPA: hypothetical protein VMT19_04585 [Thermoanaerobaculaceae bacterium]|nr:hypothetical protein [Thermoanaerobaculaceae bacterium]